MDNYREKILQIIYPLMAFSLCLNMIYNNKNLIIVILFNIIVNLHYIHPKSNATKYEFYMLLITFIIASILPIISFIQQNILIGIQ